jgi:hypothetical protein
MEFRQRPVRKSAQPRPFVFVDRIQLEKSHTATGRGAQEYGNGFADG